ncbi:hypothetical protein CV103_11090 [Sphingomonas fennica]|uniref:Uncharacterized protein n=1 Tax=Edaphosphingomonas fennica TaxID=114404 RepID=A0A2T4HYC2_9SPHN|nr:hypothetical protein CV103_11090 [Sphingomonas fennica]
MCFIEHHQVPARGVLTIAQRERNRPLTLGQALDHLSDPRAVLLVNERSGLRTCCAGSTSRATMIRQETARWRY